MENDVVMLVGVMEKEGRINCGVGFQRTLTFKLFFCT